MFKWLRKTPRRPVLDFKLNPITLTADGFSCHDFFVDGGMIEVRWGEVREIKTWKDDLFAYDEIRLGFRFGETGALGLNEVQPGFVEAVKEMQRRFPTVPENWYSEIMVPAFATKYTVLYKRESENGTAGDAAAEAAG